MAARQTPEGALLIHLAKTSKVAVPSALLPVAQVAIIEAQHGNWTGILEYPAGYQRTVEETVDSLHLHAFVTEDAN